MSDYCDGVRLGRRKVAIVAVCALLGAACGDGSTSTSGSVTDAATGDVAGDITVFAAASLSAAFSDIVAAFTMANPDAEVRLNFAGSSRLATQILEGAPVDVFASADLESMERLVAAGGVAGEPVVFATNAAAIIVAAGNPRGISMLEDLADPDLIVVQCAVEVPCGRYAESVLATAGVALTPKSLEESVNGVVTKVLLGEADAGIVYVTDVLAADDAAEGVAIPAELNIVARYPIGRTAAARDPGAAQAFVDFVLAERGRAILESYGFTLP